MQAFAAFLLGAGDGHGFGLGFEYECARGGWLAVDKYPLHQKLGAPLSRATISAAKWDSANSGENCTFTTSARPRISKYSSCLMSRKFESGTSVFVGQWLQPDREVRPVLIACVC